MPAVDPVKKAADQQQQEKLDADIAAQLLVTPKLDLVQCRFILTCASATDEEKEAAKTMIMDTVKELEMGPFYKYVCEEYKLPVRLHTLPLSLLPPSLRLPLAASSLSRMCCQAVRSCHFGPPRAMAQRLQPAHIST